MRSYFKRVGLALFLVSGMALGGTSVSGQCKLETQGLSTELELVDPIEHFGVFAQASLPGANVTLMKRSNRIVVYLGIDGAMTYSFVPIGSDGVGIIQLGTTSGNEWFSCDLTVR